MKGLYLRDRDPSPIICLMTPMLILLPEFYGVHANIQADSLLRNLAPEVPVANFESTDSMKYQKIVKQNQSFVD